MSDRSVSRVHLLIIEIAGNRFAIDTASSNGVWEDEERERATALGVDQTLSLDEVAQVTWHTFR